VQYGKVKWSMKGNHEGMNQPDCCCTLCCAVRQSCRICHVNVNVFLSLTYSISSYKMPVPTFTAPPTAYVVKPGINPSHSSVPHKMQARALIGALLRFPQDGDV
jgi:hypothetical protein